MTALLKKFADFAAKRRLKLALTSLQGYYISEDELSSWITPELLLEHDIFPYHLAPTGFRSYVMNLHVPPDVDLWGIGKFLQCSNDIDYETIAEIQAGFWEFVRHEVLVDIYP